MLFAMILMTKTGKSFLEKLKIQQISGQTFPLRIRENTIQFTMVRALLDNRHKTFGAVYLPAERSVKVM